jgi:hypothetical protein
MNIAIAGDSFIACFGRAERELSRYYLNAATGESSDR